jgi:hypothetical protein
MYHIVKTCECLDYDGVTEAKTGMMQGTLLGPNLLAGAFDFWEKKGTYEGVAESLKDKYGGEFFKVAPHRALDAVAVGLEPKAQNMGGDLKGIDGMGYDETSYTIM